MFEEHFLGTGCGQRSPIHALVHRTLRTILEGRCPDLTGEKLWLAQGHRPGLEGWIVGFQRGCALPPLEAATERWEGRRMVTGKHLP